MIHHFTWVLPAYDMTVSLIMYSSVPPYVAALDVVCLLHTTSLLMGALAFFEDANAVIHSAVPIDPLPVGGPSLIIIPHYVGYIR